MTSLTEPIKIKKGQKITQLIVSNIMYPEIKKKFLKDTERNNKGFGEMDLVRKFLNILVCIIIKHNES